MPELMIELMDNLLTKPSAEPTYEYEIKPEPKIEIDPLRKYLRGSY